MTVLQVSSDLEFPLQIILSPDWVWAQPASYSVENDFLYPGIKQTEREFNHSSPSNFGFKNLIYLLTAIGLTPGGSSTVHIYTQTIHRATQITTEQHK
jgi:hypothetical protein